MNMKLSQIVKVIKSEYGVKLNEFDYGDEWRFKVDVYSIEKMDVKLLNPQILESKGEPPQQYPYFDDEY